MDRVDLVKPGYECLINPSFGVILDSLKGKEFGELLKLNIPFRIKVFGWRWFWNRVTTKD